MQQTQQVQMHSSSIWQQQQERERPAELNILQCQLRCGLHAACAAAAALNAAAGMSRLQQGSSMACRLRHQKQWFCKSAGEARRSGALITAAAEIDRMPRRLWLHQNHSNLRITRWGGWWYRL
jgi:hypothetical protein